MTFSSGAKKIREKQDIWSEEKGGFCECHAREKTVNARETDVSDGKNVFRYGETVTWKDMFSFSQKQMDPVRI